MNIWEKARRLERENDELEAVQKRISKAIKDEDDEELEFQIRKKIRLWKILQEKIKRMDRGDDGEG